MLLDLVLAEVEDPLQHHRHDDHRGDLVLLQAVERLLGIEMTPDHHGRSERQAQGHQSKAQRVEHGHAQLDRLTGAERDLAEQPADHPQ